ncbi:pyroglutamyl-peptidase I [Cupriavidus gilardii J11]|uniref:Pyrrolidone-carboxylate peptidase n=1 Tax=Cupriavidus gilardii J11 TaxID=936133 RepID=A0A562BVS3_9BURK|nr:pyroglutamyl-peptidase I [Cupriavidus gilardii]TWG89318.1 pyroglutamyl-peptidase I [Cupriavidus gilardii J11]
MSVVLLTGFEPFDNEATNPSWEAVRALDGARVGSATIVARQLPCRFGDANEAMARLLREYRPAVAIAVGQAGGRTEMSIERVAINVDDARIADNAGRQPVDEPIVADGPAAYFASVPIKAMVRAARAAGVPAAVSQTAGTFVCNHVFYGLMHALSHDAALAGTRGGFIHIPFLPEQASRHVGAPSMGLDTLVSGLRVMVQAALEHVEDVREGGGQLH